MCLFFAFSVLSYSYQMKGVPKLGSRTEWIIKTDNSNNAIHLYSHHGGEDKFADTQSALLSAQSRWTDTSYGARIFMSNIIRDDWSSTLGFGIAVGNDTENLFEESYFHAVIDFPNQRVIFGSREWSFSDFLSAYNIQDELVEEYWGSQVSL
jgi:hypothetical protein